MRIIASLIFITAVAYGQTAAGPSLGLFYDDSSRSVRTLNGVPGAAFSSTLDVGRELAAASFGPGRAYGLGIDGQSGDLVLLRPGSPAQTLLADQAGAVIALSDDGNSAAVYQPSTHSLRFVRMLDSTPQVSDAIDVAVGDSATAMAVANAAGYALLAAGGQVLRVSAAGAEMLQQAGSISSIAIAPDGATALAVDAENGKLLRIDNGSVSPMTLDAPEHPRAVAYSRDGKVAAIAADGEVVIAPLDGSPAAHVQCECRPSAVRRLRGNAIFGLTHDSGPWALTLDAERAEPQIFSTTLD